MGVGNASAAICRRSGDFTFASDPNFPDGACGSGSSAFDILEEGSGHSDLTRRYNDGGLWTDLVAHNTVAGSLVNSVTHASIPFTANYTYRETFVTPGEPSAGSNITLDGLRYQVTLLGRGLVVHDVGALRVAPDGMVSAGGPHPILLGGDITDLCAALGGA
jgi:hypothetical protein